MSLKVVSRSCGLHIATIDMSGVIELEPAEINLLLRELKNYLAAGNTVIKFGSLDPVRADHVQCGKLSEDIAERELTSTVFAASLGVVRYDSSHTLGENSVSKFPGEASFRETPPDERKEAK